MSSDILQMFNTAASDWLTRKLELDTNLNESGLVTTAQYTASDGLRDAFISHLPVKALPMKKELAEPLKLWLGEDCDTNDKLDAWLKEAAQDVLPSFSLPLDGDVL